VGAALDLNEANEEMLRQFFAQGLEVDYAEADRITQAILDWRDEDDLPRINGGEREQYLEEEMLVFPPNRDFTDIDELRHVMGMTPEIFASAAPYLTLIGSDEINVNSAPEPVLNALPGMTRQGVEAIIRLRESGNLPTNNEEFAAMVPDAAQAFQTRGRTFSGRVAYTTNQVEILSEGWVEGGLVRVSSRVVVSRANDEARVVWREVF
jgi:type II secretory pathway component PulK